MVNKIEEIYVTNGTHTALQQNLQQPTRKYNMIKEEGDLCYVCVKIQGDHKTHHSNQPSGDEKLI